MIEKSRYLLVGFVLLASRPVSSESEPFTIVLLPDTQNYTTPGLSGTPEMFTAQTAWIAENAERLNIPFVLHEGDITNYNDTAGWLNAVASMSLLDGVVPYVLAVGNHDGLGTSVGNTTNFNTHFPSSKYESLPSFGGVFEPGKLDNSYHLFSAGGIDWLVLALEFGPRDVVLDWADGIISDHPARRVIVLTHTHIYNDDRLHGSLDRHAWRPVETYGRENNGDDVWHEILKRHANVTLVFNGHVLGDGQGRTVGTGDAGNSVYQILTNFQVEAGGGNGFLRLIQISPTINRLQASTYSPYLNEHRLSEAHQFAYEDLGLVADGFAPQLVRYATPNETQLILSFDEPLDSTIATRLTSYAMSAGVEVTAAELASDARSVLLTTSDRLPCQSYRLTLNALADRAPAPNVIAANTERTIRPTQVLLSDSFDGSQAQHWHVVDDGKVQAPSDWRLRGGRLVQLSNIHGPDASATSKREGTIIYYRQPEAKLWRDYVLELAAMSTDDDGLGVVFRYVDADNYYKLDFDRQRHFRKLFKLVDGVETLLAESSEGYPADRQLAIRVEAVGTGLRVLLGGDDLFGLIEDSDLGAGTVGVYAWGTDHLLVDDLLVTTAPGTACPPCPGGAQDYRPCYDGPAGSAGIGQCRRGEQLCHAGIWSVCLGQVVPAASEDCFDGADNNCDGTTDEADVLACGCANGERRGCYTGAAGTAGIGRCQEGEETCGAGQWGPCQGEILPGPELCDDELDNDCDDLTDSADEDCPSTTPDQPDQPKPEPEQPATPSGCACQGGTVPTGLALSAFTLAWVRQRWRLRPRS